MSRLAKTILGSLALLGGCSPSAAESPCFQEPLVIPVVRSVTLDIEDMVEGVVEKIGSEPLWDDIQPIATSCKPPATLPNQLDPLAQAVSRHLPKPVQLVNLPGVSGVVFAYFSQGEEEVVTGIATALVEYHPDGTPARTFKVAEVLRGEGWGRHTLSNLTQESIQYCSQEIEYFGYADNGDVIGELDSPTRTQRVCEEARSLPVD